MGVVGAIIPRNVPLLLMALKVWPASVAGNAVVVKSAEEAPLTVIAWPNWRRRYCRRDFSTCVGHGARLRRAAGPASAGA